MRLLTNGEEHHGIGDGGSFMMTMATISPLRSPKRTPDLPSRWRTGGGGASVSKTRRKLLFLFFLGRKATYRAGVGGGRAVWAPQACPPPPGGGGGAGACGPLAQPLRWNLAQIFLIFSKTAPRKFSGRLENFDFCTKITPRQFCWKQRQSRLVPFKSCKLESKTRAKEFGKVDTLETYQSTATKMWVYPLELGKGPI